jgi:AcrR family transcriptional regulator
VHVADAAYQLKTLSALDAAERVFAQRGFGRATMRDVADAARQSIAGLYYYLPSKQRALALVCDRAFRELLARLERACANAGTPQEQLVAFVRGHVDFVVHNPNAFHVLLRDLDALEGQDRVAVFELRRQYFARAADLVIAVQQSVPSMIETRTATAALFGMMNWTPMWRHGIDDHDAAGIARQMTQLFLHGVTTTGFSEVPS